MEEIEELRRKAIASMPSTSANPNSMLNKEPSQAREEGELSSSDDEIPSDSAGQSAGTTTLPVESNVDPVNKRSQGNRISANDPTSVGDIQLRTSLKYSKPLKMSSVPSKSVSRHTPGWYAPSAANNNLVISFSDGDSESDSEEYKAERVSERKGNRDKVDESKRPGSLQLESEYLRRTANIQKKRMPDKVSSSRTFISSMNKIHGSNSRASGPLVEQMPQKIRNSDSIKKMPVSYEQGSNQSMISNNSKLERLRQQIAIKENELRLQHKSVQQGKKTNSGIHQNYNAVNEKVDAAKKSRSPYVDTKNLVHSEPDKKRLRPDDSCQSKLSLDIQQRVLGPVTNSLSKSKMALVENIDCKGNNLLACGRSTNEIPIGKLDQHAEKQHEKVHNQISVLPENLITGENYSESSIPLLEEISSAVTKLKPNKHRSHSGPGADVPFSCSLTDKSTAAKLMDPSNVLNRRTMAMKVTSKENDETAGQLKMPCPNESASIINTSLLNCSDQLNLFGNNSFDIQSLVKLEETHDRELEEAQEHRHRCEQEERKALKAYREAQRSLVEANARCTYIYRRRELFSAKLRAFMMEDSSSLWHSRWQKHTEAELNSLGNVHQAAVDPIHTLGHQMQAEIEVLNQLGSDSNIQGTDSVVLHTSYQHMEAQKLISEPCSEPDASMSDLLNNKDNGAVDGVYTPSNHTNMSADEDEDMLLLDDQSKLLSEEEENFGKRELTTNGKPETISLTDGAQDCALLEASLRSKLFASLGTNKMSKNSNLQIREGITSSRCSEHLLEDEKAHMSKRDEPYAVDGQKQLLLIGEACSSTANASTIPSSAVKVAFSLIAPTSCSGSQIQVPCLNKISHIEEATIGCSEFFGFSGEHLLVDSQRTNCGGIGSYTCDLSIDPFWPICMFELRGKCNDEECQWQHVKDYSERNIKHHHCAASADSDAGSLSCPEKFSCAHKLSKFHWDHIISASPTYLVGLDLHKPELHTSRSVFGRTVGQFSQKGFSTSSAVLYSVQKNVLHDVPFFHDSDGRLWGHGSWIRQSSYANQDGVMKLLKNGLADPEQTLEMTLGLINEEFHKPERKKKALSLLSRALEVNPTSVALWIVYLNFYYCNEKAVGKDDMFYHAIHYNEDSYELWLMYINSRAQIDDRLLAYDSALSALCRHACTTDWDKVHGSACILDLFLQMMDFFCMSGNTGKTVERICGLFPIATDVSEHDSVLLSDILTYLTVSDKYIFWICCVYLVIYRKLPEKVVELFEFEKELSFGIGWPSAKLTAEERHRALKLMKMGVDSVTLGLTGGEAPRIAHLLAVSHVRCVEVLEGIECSKNLLDKYIIQYPTCIELVLTSARLHVNLNGVSGLQKFEDTLRNWPSETSGIQCIWNQYVQCALESGETNLAKQLIVRWFQSVWKVNCSQSGKLCDRDDNDLHTQLNQAFSQLHGVGYDNDLHDSLKSCSFPREDASIASKPKDDLFGLLNLSLHRLLLKDQVGARLAIDKALMVAAPEDFKHCVQEHATFVLSQLSEPMEYASGCGMLGLLNNYILDARFLRVSEPLSRRFSQDLRRPRIRQLINKILGPTSSDFSLINSVFESCYGPSLLPGNFAEIKDLVDFVEPLMKIYPANYRLTMSVCNFVASKSNSESVASASVIFWASSLLVNSIYQAFPVAPEHAWVEVAGVLSKLGESQGLFERFHQHALLVYPFSIKLWKSYYNLAKTTGNLTLVIEKARERGIKLDRLVISF